VDALKDTGDVLLTGARSVPTLTTGAASSASKTVVVPAATPLGTYRLLACADDTFKVLESDEANNCREAATPVIVQ
jgi:subtilase family serine protease